MAPNSWFKRKGHFPPVNHDVQTLKLTALYRQKVDISASCADDYFHNYHERFSVRKDY